MNKLNTIRGVWVPEGDLGLSGAIASPYYVTVKTEKFKYLPEEELMVEIIINNTGDVPDEDIIGEKNG